MLILLIIQYALCKHLYSVIVLEPEQSISLPSLHHRTIWNTEIKHLPDYTNNQTIHKLIETNFKGVKVLKHKQEQFIEERHSYDILFNVVLQNLEPNFTRLEDDLEIALSDESLYLVLSNQTLQINEHVFFVEKDHYKEFAQTYFQNISKVQALKSTSEGVTFQIDKLVQSLTGCDDLLDLIDRIDNYEYYVTLKKLQSEIIIKNQWMKAWSNIRNIHAETKIRDDLIEQSILLLPKDYTCSDTSHRYAILSAILVISILAKQVYDYYKLQMKDKSV